MALEALSGVLDRLTVLWEAIVPDTRPANGFRRLVGLRDPDEVGEVSRGFEFEETARTYEAAHPGGAQLRYEFSVLVYYQDVYEAEALDQMVREDASRLSASAMTATGFPSGVVHVDPVSSRFDAERAVLRIELKALVIETFI